MKLPLAALGVLLAAVARDSGGAELPRIADLQTVAKELAAAAGTTVSVAPELRTLKTAWIRGSADPRSMLKDLATCASASLTNTVNGLAIVRDPAQKAAIRAKDRELVRAALSKALERWDQSAPPPEADIAVDAAQRFSQYIQVMDLQRNPNLAAKGGATPRRIPEINPVLPAGRLLRYLIGRLGTGVVADLDPGSSVFFSNSTEADEVPLPDCQDLLDRFAREREEFRTNAAKHIDWERWRSERLATFDVEDATPDPRQIKIVLHVRRDELWLVCKLLCFAPDGHLTDAAWLASVPPGQQPNFALEAQSLARAGDLSADLTEPSNRFIAHFPDIGASRPILLSFKSRPSIAALRGKDEMFTSPDRVEPDTLVLPEALAALRPTRKSPFLAVLPDDAWALALGCSNANSVNLEAFKRLALQGGIGGPVLVEQKLDEGFPGFRPIDPYLSEGSQADRPALAEGIRGFLEQGRVPLRSLSLLRFRLGRASDREVASRYLTDIRWADGRAMGAGSSEFFRFLGSIPEDTWQRLIRGGGGTIESAEEATRLHNSIILGDWRLKSPRHLTQLEAQPQEVYQETVHPDAPLTFKIWDEAAAVSWSGQGSLDPGATTLDANELGDGFGTLILSEQRMRSMTHKTAESDEQALGDILSRIPLKFRLAPRRNYTIVIGDPQGTRAREESVRRGRPVDSGSQLHRIAGSIPDPVRPGCPTRGRQTRRAARADLCTPSISSLSATALDGRTP